MVYNFCAHLILIALRNKQIGKHAAIPSVGEGRFDFLHSGWHLAESTVQKFTALFETEEMYLKIL